MVEDYEEDSDTRYGFNKAENDPRSSDEIISSIVKHNPIELDKQIDTLEDPLIIECACPGWQPREWPDREIYEEIHRGSDLPPHYEEGGVRYPAVPCSIEDQVDEIVNAVEAGCATTHIHPRDPADCLGSESIDLLTEVYDRIYEQTDVVAIQDCWEITPDGSIDYITPAEENLEADDGGNRYVEGALMLWTPSDSYPDGYREQAQAGVEFYEEQGIKPIIKVRSAYHARKMYRDVIEPGVLSDQPYVVLHDMGHPFGWPMDNTQWMPIDMIASIQQTMERLPDDTITGVCSGGRNWLPITLMAIMLGLDYVRIGIEDLYWMYPHKDEIIQENMDVVNKIVDFCDIIGREVATPDQARDIMGLEDPKA